MSTKDDNPVRYVELPYGFLYGSCKIERLFSDPKDGRVTLSIQTDRHPGHSLQVTVTRSGMVRIADTKRGLFYHMEATPAKGYIAGGEKYFYPLAGDPKPAAGKKVMLLTIGGVEVTGTWTDDGRYLGWARLHSRDSAKEKVVQEKLAAMKGTGNG